MLALDAFIATSLGMAVSHLPMERGPLMEGTRSASRLLWPSTRPASLNRGKNPSFSNTSYAASVDLLRRHHSLPRAIDDTYVEIALYSFAALFS